MLSVFCDRCDTFLQKTKTLATERGFWLFVLTVLQVVYLVEVEMR